MGSFPTKAQIDVASVRRNGFDLSNQSIGTLDFGYLQPCFVRSTYPECKFNVKRESFLRTAPMVVPPFARCSVHFDTFFVPFYQIWKNFKHFYEGSKGVNPGGSAVTIDTMPYFTMNTILKVLTNDKVISDGTGTLFGTVRKVTLSGDNIMVPSFFILKINQNKYKPDPNFPIYDFVYCFHTNSNNKVDFYYCLELNEIGRRFVNILFGLGYGCGFSFDPLYEETTSANSYYYTEFDDTKISAVRLLSLIKVYLDWYESPQFTLGSSKRSIFNKIFDLNLGSEISYQDLRDLFVSPLSRCFEPDFYTSAWLKPYQSASDANISSNMFVKPSAELKGDGNKGAYIDGFGDDDVLHKQLTLSLMEKYQEFITRYSLSGSRDIDRYMAEFGVRSKEVELLRSFLVSSESQVLQISDIMSTADTQTGSTGLALGDYAGKGLSFGDGSFGFETNDFGVLFTLCSIVPHVGYAYGRQKETEHVKLLDFPTGEYDCVGPEAISFSQLQCDLHRSMSHSKSIFGFAPRYAHAKIGNDLLFGDFRLPTRDSYMESWHFIREFDLEPLGNFEDFRKIATQNLRFNRIFNVNSSNYDHFYIFSNFAVHAEMPYKSITDVYEVNHVDDGEPHKRISVDYGGKQL